MINYKKIRELRKSQKLNQAELALKTGVSPDEIGKLERGKIDNPRLDTIIKIVDYFKVSIDWLCDRDV